MSSYSYASRFVLNVPSNMQMRIYGGATATSETLVALRGGSIVTDMGASSNGWRYVSYKTSNGQEHFGFMYDGANNYLQETSAQPGAARQSPSAPRNTNNQNTYHVAGTRSCLFLRPRATTSGDRGCYTNGTNVTKTGRTRNNFSEVRLPNGRTGWMGSRYLQRGAATTTEAAAPCVDCQARISTRGIPVGSGAFANYHRNPAVAGMIAACARRYPGSRSSGYCLRGVRLAGQESGLLRSGVNLTSWASTSGPSLSQQGFINLLNDRSFNISGPNDSDIPIGAILVYSGRNGSGNTTVPLGRGIGHAEIKSSNNSYCSDYTGSTPGGAGRIRSGMQGGTGRRTRRLIGVWVKPGL